MTSDFNLLLNLETDPCNLLHILRTVLIDVSFFIRNVHLLLTCIHRSQVSFCCGVINWTVAPLCNRGQHWLVNGFWRFFHLNMQLLKSFHSFHSPSRSSSMLPIMNYDWIKRERNSNIWGSISMSDMRSMKSLKYSLHLSSSSKLKCNCLAINSVFLLDIFVLSCSLLFFRCCWSEWQSLSKLKSFLVQNTG